MPQTTPSLPGAFKVTVYMPQKPEVHLIGVETSHAVFKEDIARLNTLPGIARRLLSTSGQDAVGGISAFEVEGTAITQAVRVAQRTWAVGTPAEIGVLQGAGLLRPGAM